jgi:hypothetical protein
LPIQNPAKPRKAGSRKTRREPDQPEKDEPQPHDLVEFGLMKLKPWRINVSS